ncbi:Crp/Fnr family transcriptional regulator [Burkholderia lata]|uniref:Crp/Fnr family transcriptional regulator n=1 Tax=Burkholderia lata (strain ATCC 17760 / DSM 23089 / LMG 22485 / NCIMB 9086 / R18194 / 383) TaxID=482957 RepID=A0A6P2NL96_BURL3|nr:fumarate/nitrate reduction transcriptional regulator Fnr [Burkholderia lata]VWB95348.1 Crp/Fnr family transcriptional regulator [Burkholderia lata]
MQSHAEVSMPPLSRPFIPLHSVERSDQPKRASSRCSSCALHAACLPQALTPDDFARVDAMICTTRHIKRGDTLYRAGDTFNSIYAVRTGSFKTVVMHRDGDAQVTGFQIAGESLGLDGVHTGRHNGDAIALEDSTVCIIPFGQLEQMCREVQSMQHHVYQMMSGEIVRESALMLLLGTMSAEQRVAAFLLNLSTRFKARGYSAAEFVLRMTRDEIGEYLGMKLETVSRMLSKFQQKGLVAAQGKQIRIVDSEGLARL